MQYDLLVGADGARSAVRAALQEQVAGFACETVYRSAASYKTFAGLSLDMDKGSADTPGVSASDPWVAQILAPDFSTHQPNESLYSLMPAAKAKDRKDLPMLHMWMPQPGVLGGLVTRVARCVVCALVCVVRLARHADADAGTLQEWLAGTRQRRNGGCVAGRGEGGTHKSYAGHQACAYIYRHYMVLACMTAFCDYVSSMISHKRKPPLSSPPMCAPSSSHHMCSFEPSALAAALQEAYPSLPAAWRASIVEQTSDKRQPASSFGQVLRCSQLHGPRVVLLGDAGHAITSMLGGWSFYPRLLL